MQCNHSLRIKKVYYNGTKKLKVRVSSPQIKRLKAGGTITFSAYSSQKFESVPSNKNEVKIWKASNYVESNHKLFSEIVSKAYTPTDHICKDYPNHFTWYWEKTVPAVIRGTREIMIATVDKNVAGVIFLKKEDGEKKICTLLVLEEYRGRGIATLLLEESFKYLETTKPLISIANYKIDQFCAIIKKYEWVQTQILDDGYYNDTSRELVFNGTIY